MTRTGAIRLGHVAMPSHSYQAKQAWRGNAASRDRSLVPSQVAPTG